MIRGRALPVPQARAGLVKDAQARVDDDAVLVAARTSRLVRHGGVAWSSSSSSTSDGECAAKGRNGVITAPMLEVRRTRGA
jgi:hypothetical protein